MTGTGQCTGQLQGGSPDFVAENQLRVFNYKITILY